MTDSIPENFPVQSFYNSEKNEVISLYRQGQCFTINASDIEQFNFQDISDRDLGQMYLFNNKVLMCMSASMIFFYRQEEVSPGKVVWKHYDTVDQQGHQMYFIKNTNCIQVTTEEKIFFYKIDEETLKPSL